MATDFLFSGMAVPVFLILFGLIASTLLSVAKRNLPSIGWEFSARRLLFGYTGAAVALLLFSYVEATQIGRNKVDLGHIQAAELGRWILFWGFYVFVLYSAFAFFVLTLIGLPLIAALSRFRFASVLGVTAICIALSSLIAAWAAKFPVNNWCEANLALCVWQSASKFFVAALTVGLGFAVFARMPLMRNDKPMGC